jgi:hypothetical protein
MDTADKRHVTAREEIQRAVQSSWLFQGALCDRVALPIDLFEIF